MLLEGECIRDCRKMVKVESTYRRRQASLPKWNGTVVWKLQLPRCFKMGAAPHAG
ncbi:hypothetical protein OESDEN_12676 [Oesophagostomum dentatum]|uniref:Uncharacterized protein n=1 Tax=Oesophagostomum dentatum TaxID=61180 RepID=A0A0B1SQE7_OESDE|nr:hypothetical protein OESDEN_12676 [Oesophagostomum dentatum]